MKKIILSIVVASSCVLATSIEPFVGLDFVNGNIYTKESLSGTATISGKTTTGSATYEETLKDNTFGLKVGAIIENNHRVYFSYYKLEDKVYGETVSYQLPSLNYDYLIINDKLNGFMPYVGAQLGYGKTEFAPVLGESLGSTSSLSYGINFGVIKEIVKNFSLELAYKYTFINQSSSISGTIVNGADSITGTYEQENKAAQVFTFGANYKF
nr:outer membrane beta-barrel protein [uncultured Sulfurimonas sp.]